MPEVTRNSQQNLTAEKHFATASLDDPSFWDEPNPFARAWDKTPPFVPSDTLKDMRTESLQVLPTERTGLGLFATRPLSEGEQLFVVQGTTYKGNLSSLSEAFFGDWNAITVEVDRWLSPSPDSPLRYLNHSCNPNAGRRSPYVFVAIRAIRAGEEVTADYSLLETHPEWSMKCHCGCEGCRGDIKSIQHLPPDFVRSFWKYLPEYMREVYREHLRERQQL